MTVKSSVTCDACGRDLTSTGNNIDWRLALVPQRIPSRGGIVTDMMIPPAIEETAHFCEIACLEAWFVKTFGRPIGGAS